MTTSKLINYTTREFMSENELELYATKQDELKGQDERHLSNMKADGNSWLTVYRKMDKTEINPFVNLHLKSSEQKGYSFSQVLNFSRCIDNELK